MVTIGTHHPTNFANFGTNSTTGTSSTQSTTNALQDSISALEAAGAASRQNSPGTPSLTHGGTRNSIVGLQSMDLRPSELAKTVDSAVNHLELGFGKGYAWPDGQTPRHLDGTEEVVLPQTFAFLHGDGESVDYPKRTAHVDKENNRFWLSVQGNFGNDEKVLWFGPKSLHPKEEALVFDAEFKNPPSTKATPLDKAPDVDGRVEILMPQLFVWLPENHDPIHWPRQAAFVDTEANNYFLKVSGREGEPTYWYGPKPLNPQTAE